MILTAGGKKYVHMRARHGWWLVNGESFLAHLADLQSVGLQCVCGRCRRKVYAEKVEGSQSFRVGCECKAGKVDTTRQLDVEPLLLALGWSLVCADCGEKVVGDNAPSDAQWTVECPCSARVIKGMA